MNCSHGRCPLCGGTSGPCLTACDRNREITAARFHYNRCNDCATVFMIDPPADLSRYYAGRYHGFDATGAPEWMYNATLREIELSRVGMLRRHVADGVLIDVGAGAGGFVAAAKDAGFDVTAIEMDARCCEYLETEIGVRAICSEDPIAILRSLPPARAISLWHVLEHLRDPGEMLTAAAETLEPGGVLALGVPNPDSLQFRLLGSRWAHLDAPRHLQLIPAKTLVSRLAALGLAPLEMTTRDPFGTNCNLFGWTCALRARPARGAPSASVIRLARMLTGALRPIEEGRNRGAALTVVFGKS